MPSRIADDLIATVAQAERKAIGDRTRAALAAARARGIQLGNPQLSRVRPKAVRAVIERSRSFASNTLPLIRDLRAAGCNTLQSVADALNARGVKTARNSSWTPTAVRRVLVRVGASPARCGP